MTTLKAKLSISSVEFHKTYELQPASKAYLCFHINGKYPHSAQCVKLRIIKKVVDYILSIDTFEKQCVVVKGILQSPCLEDHMKTIDIYQSLSNRPSIKHKSLN